MKKILDIMENDLRKKDSIRKLTEVVTMASRELIAALERESINIPVPGAPLALSAFGGAQPSGAPDLSARVTISKPSYRDYQVQINFTIRDNY